MADIRAYLFVVGRDDAGKPTKKLRPLRRCDALMAAQQYEKLSEDELKDTTNDLLAERDRRFQAKWRA